MRITQTSPLSPLNTNITSHDSPVKLCIHSSITICIDCKQNREEVKYTNVIQLQIYILIWNMKTRKPIECKLNRTLYDICQLILQHIP